MASPTPTNSAAQTVDEIIQLAIFDVALKAAEAAIIADLPFLGLPIIDPIFLFFMEQIGGVLYKQIALGTTFIVIDIQVGLEKSAYTQAEAALRAAHLTGNQDAIQNATASFKSAFQKLFHYDGSYSPT